MPAVTRQADATIRRTIQHFNMGGAAGKTDSARACSPIGISTQNEKLVSSHTKQMGRKAKAHIEAVACSRHRIHRSIAPDSAPGFDTKKALRSCRVWKKTPPRQFDLRMMAANRFAFFGDLRFRRR